MSDLESLLERVKAASGPDRMLDDALHWQFSDWNNIGGWWREHKVTGARERFSSGFSPEAFTASIDAALALVERVLPGFVLRVQTADPTCSEHSPYRKCEAILAPRLHNDEGWQIGIKVAYAPTPPLAILAALLTALIAQEREAA
jgi:hypothetical protein